MGAGASCPKCGDDILTPSVQDPLHYRGDKKYIKCSGYGYCPNCGIMYKIILESVKSIS